MSQPPERRAPMSPIARFLREPMVHFLAIGIAVFAFHAALREAPRPAPQPDERIVVTQGRVNQLARIFAMTWQRPPTRDELRGLIDTFVKEEVYYREAVKLGLDRDDTVVRRRMRQKLEFLIEPDDDALVPADARLLAHLEANRESFRIPQKTAFEQIFISTDRKNPEARAAGILDELRAASPVASPVAFSDRTLLPKEMGLSTHEAVARNFGRNFADALTSLPVGEWAGPVSSSYGLHLVRVTDRQAAVDPPLEEIRQAVARSWREARRREHMRAAYERMKAKYRIVLPPGIGHEKRKASLE